MLVRLSIPVASLRSPADYKHFMSKYNGQDRPGEHSASCVKSKKTRKTGLFLFGSGGSIDHMMNLRPSSYEPET